MSRGQSGISRAEDWIRIVLEKILPYNVIRYKFIS